jgi:hypothetical protein
LPGKELQSAWKIGREITAWERENRGIEWNGIENFLKEIALIRFQHDDDE